VLPIDDARPFQHPAARAQSSARNAVAAEMSVAGRAGFRPGERCWEDAARALTDPGESRWVLASDDYWKMRADLAAVTAVGADTFAGERPSGDGSGGGLPADAPAAGTPSRSFFGPEMPFGTGLHSHALAGLAVPLPGVRAAADGPGPAGAGLLRRPVARARRERLEMAFWFAVGGAGGLVLAVLVRAAELAFAWR
jgi:hypothetical protein